MKNPLLQREVDRNILGCDQVAGAIRYEQRWQYIT